MKPGDIIITEDGTRILVSGEEEFSTCVGCHLGKDEECSKGLVLPDVKCTGIIFKVIGMANNPKCVSKPYVVQYPEKDPLGPAMGVINGVKYSVAIFAAIGLAAWLLLGK